MPLFAPRSETIKKQDQLAQRLFELQIAIEKNALEDKLNRLAEKYRAANLSLLKATLHIIREKEFRAFRKKCAERGDIKWVFIITDSEENFATMRRTLGRKHEWHTI